MVYFSPFSIVVTLFCFLFSTPASTQRHHHHKRHHQHSDTITTSATTNTATPSPHWSATTNTQAATAAGQHDQLVNGDRTERWENTARPKSSISYCLFSETFVLHASTVVIKGPWAWGLFSHGTRCTNLLWSLSPSLLLLLRMLYTGLHISVSVFIFEF